MYKINSKDASEQIIKEPALTNESFRTLLQFALQEAVGPCCTLRDCIRIQFSLPFLSRLECTDDIHNILWQPKG